MPPNNVIKVIVVFAALFVVALFGRLISSGDMFLAAGLVLGVAAGIITFLNPENGLILLVFSMMLSPEIELAKIPGRSVTIRIDDLLLIGVFIAYVTYHAVNPQVRRFIRTPIGRPLIATVIIYFISTALGNIEGRLKPLASMFFVLKYVQYFLLFWLASNLTSSRETLKRVVVSGAITAVIVCVYAYSLFGSTARVYAPFDHEAMGHSGESATLGGYLIIVMSLALAFFANHDSPRVRMSALGLFFFAVPPFVKTLSRASYYSFVVVLPALVFFSEKRKLALALGAGVFILLAPVLSPTLTGEVKGRLEETFRGGVPEFGVSVDPSTAARVQNWRRVWTEWLPSRPLLGHGATGVGLVDAQYPRVLGEFGLVGFAAFAWLLFSIFSAVFRVIKTSPDGLSRTVGTGFLAAFFALLVQSMGVNTFIIVRIMTPFWFLLGVIVAQGQREIESNAGGGISWAGR